MRLADHLAALPRAAFDDCRSVQAAVQAHALGQWRSTGFFRVLNRMLFLAAAPAARRKVMARFYRLRGPLVARYSAGRSSWLDKARILTGRPPVPLGAALRAVFSPVPPVSYPPPSDGAAPASHVAPIP